VIIRKHQIKKIRETNGSLRVATVNTLPSRTNQQFKDECDLKLIMKKYQGNPPIPASNAIFADISELPDYQTALHTVIAAERSFASLPSKLRNRFSNDPHEFIEFLQDPSNDSEAVKLGLKTKPPKVTTGAKNDDSNDEILTTKPLPKTNPSEPTPTPSSKKARPE